MALHSMSHIRFGVISVYHHCPTSSSLLDLLMASQGMLPPSLPPMVGSQLADGQAHFVICETCLKATVIPAALLPKRLSPSLTWKAQKHGLY